MHENIEAVYKSAFLDCTNLSSINIPDSVFYVGPYAFDCRDGLTSITLPSSLRIIHNYAFCECVNLKEIYCKGLTPPYLNNYYSNYHDDVVLYVPVGAMETYKDSDHMGCFENVAETDFK